MIASDNVSCDEKIASVNQEIRIFINDKLISIKKENIYHTFSTMKCTII